MNLSKKINRQWLSLILVLTAYMVPSKSAAQFEAPAMQLRSNIIYDLAACTNIGLEIQTDKGLAFQFDYIGAWWNKPIKNRFFSNYLFHTELRYYLSSRTKGTPYLGHHIGAYAILGTYDFEFGNEGLLCEDLDKTWSLGLSYGYEIKLSKYFSMDFTAGVGYFSSEYDAYEPKTEGKGYHRIDTRRFTFFGPTKLEVALVWNLNVFNSPSYTFY